MRFCELRSAQAFRDATRDLPNRMEVELAVSNMMLELVARYDEEMGDVVQRIFANARGEGAKS